MSDSVRNTAKALQLREAVKTREEREAEHQAENAKIHHAGMEYMRTHFGDEVAGKIHHHAQGLGHTLQDKSHTAEDHQHIIKHLIGRVKAESGAPALPHGIHVSSFREHTADQSGHIAIRHGDLPNVEVHGARKKYHDAVEHSHISMSSGRLRGEEDESHHAAILAYAKHHRQRMSTPSEH